MNSKEVKFNNPLFELALSLLGMVRTKKRGPTSFEPLGQLIMARLAKRAKILLNKVANKFRHVIGHSFVFVFLISFDFVGFIFIFYGKIQFERNLAAFLILLAGRATT